MWSNLLFGLLIPWAILFLLYRKNQALVLVMYPLGIAIAFVANNWGFGLFWEMEPLYDNPSLSAIPVSLGYFPLVTSLFAYTRNKKYLDAILLILLFSTVTTFIEYLTLWAGKIHYLNGWNIIFTFFIYLAGFTITELYIRIQKKYRITF